MAPESWGYKHQLTFLNSKSWADRQVFGLNLLKSFLSWVVLSQWCYVFGTHSLFWELCRRKINEKEDAKTHNIGDQQLFQTRIDGEYPKQLRFIPLREEESSITKLFEESLSKPEHKKVSLACLQKKNGWYRVMNESSFGVKFVLVLIFFKLCYSRFRGWNSVLKTSSVQFRWSIFIIVSFLMLDIRCNLIK